jgi:hypothetical protein
MSFRTASSRLRLPSRRARRRPDAAGLAAFAQWQRTGHVPTAPVPRLPDLLARRGPAGAQDAVWLQRCIAAAALASTVAVAPIDDANAAGAQLGVSVTVPLVAAMQMHYQVPTLSIDADDIARGYVDVVAGSRFSVATTSRDGYVVDLVPRLALFSAVEVVLAGTRAVLGPDGGALVARGRPRRDANAEVTYRFRLADGIAPGVYPFPLDLAVRPL